MKINTREHTDIVFGASEEIAVTIAANAVSFMASTVGLAKDKIGYPVREICSNAWDAARGAFEVQLPTRHDPIFRVRDFGPGMDHAAMVGRYAVLYESSKRDRDDQVGSWGAGRFSPFAYLQTADGTAPYTVTSYTGGHARTYVVSLNATGTPVIRMMADVASSEPTGLEVAFAVRDGDIDTFHAKAREILWGFEPRPTITPAIEWSEPGIKLSGEGWMLYETDTVPFKGPHVRMGCAVYPVDLREVEDRSMLSVFDTILFEAPIGSLSPTLSREALAYDDRTKATLNRLMRVYREAYVASVQAKVDLQPSLFKAAEVIADIGTVSLRDSVRRDMRWRGMPVPSAVETALRDTGARHSYFGAGWTADNRIRFDPTSHFGMAACVDAAIVIEHGKSHSIRKLVLAGLEGKKLLWIRCEREARDRVIAALGNPPVVDLDAVKIERDASRPKTVRRRRTYEVNANGRLQAVTKDIDTADRLVVIDGIGDGYYGTASLGPMVSMRSDVFRESIGVLRQLGLIQEGFTLLIKTPSEAMQRHWTWFSDWVTARLRPMAAEFTPNGLEGLTLGSLSRRATWLSSLPETVMVGLPASLRPLVMEAVEIRERIRTNEQTNTAAYRAHRQLKLYDSTLVSRVVQNPVEALETRIIGLCERLPLLGMIVNQASQWSGYRSSESDKSHAALIEYGRLLAIAEQQAETMQEAA